MSIRSKGKNTNHQEQKKSVPFAAALVIIIVAFRNAVIGILLQIYPEFYCQSEVFKSEVKNPSTVNRFCQTLQIFLQSTLPAISRR